MRKTVFLIAVFTAIASSCFAQTKKEMKRLQQWAESGHAPSQWYLGLHYYNGNGVEKDYEKAAIWYRKAAEQGYDTAQSLLGNCYYCGHGVSQNYEEAVMWYKKAAEQGEAGGQNGLGDCYYYGHGVNQNYEEAVMWYKKAAEQDRGYSAGLAQIKLGECYYYGHGVSQNYEEAVMWYKKTAKRRFPLAQIKLGECYYYGHGVNQNYEEAVMWYNKAAEQGYAAAQYKLGECYYNSKGVNQDYAEAARWYRKAAEQGEAGGQNGLGDCYYYGHGVNKNYEEAVMWYRKAAEQGEVRGQYRFGDCYYYGYGVKQNYTEAARWYGKAAEQGNPEAQYRLGVCYYYGHGVNQNYEEAARWYRKAAEQGNPGAQYNLGACYEKNDRGVSQDYVEAARWYRKAAEQGNVFAKLALARLGDNTPQKSLASMTWLDYKDITQQQDYSFKIGVKSDSKIEDINVYVNGVLTRGISSVANDGYNMTIDKTVALNDGQNTIKVMVKNAGGTSTTEKTVIYQNQSVATIDWIDFSPTIEGRQYMLNVGIKSQSKIETCRILLNNIEIGNGKGLNLVKADDYQMKIKEKLTLANGENLIRIEVINGGKEATTSEKKIICKANDIVLQEKRLALVIGNGAYTSPCFNRLENTLNDAKIMYDKLKSLGFDMRPLVLDANRTTMWNAIADFINETDRGNYEVALLYYSGHGLSPDGGANYLIPVDANIEYLDDIKRDGINSQTDLIAKLEEKNCRVKIALLDCCNNCNVPEKGVKSTANRGGLAMIKPPYGIYILHAAQPRKTALDAVNNSKNSPFVEAFLDCTNKYGNQPWPMFVTEVVNTVDQMTNGQQIPYPEGQLRGKHFYLNPNKIE